jgi:hypothetical protein
MWEPDTHPGVEIHTQWDTENPEAPHVCLAVFKNGEAQSDPEGLYQIILAENVSASNG